MNRPNPTRGRLTLSEQRLPPGRYSDSRYSDKLSRSRVKLGRFMILEQAGWIGTVQMCCNYSSGNLRKHNPTQ